MWSPKAVSKYHDSLGDYKNSGEKICLSHQLYRDICRVLKLRPTKALGPGRGVTNLVETLQALEVDGFSDPTSAPDLLSGLASSSVAHNISVENVALPDDAGRVDPCMILSEPYLSDFKDFENRLIRPPPLAEELPVPCHKVLRKDEKQLRHTLLQNHMARIISGRTLSERRTVGSFSPGYSVFLPMEEK